MLLPFAVINMVSKEGCNHGSNLFFLTQVFFFSSIQLILAALKPAIRLICSYIYIGLILFVGGFLGTVYSIPLTDSITISGGSIAYGALMMSTIVLVIIGRDLDVVRNIIRIVIAVNIFKYLFFSATSRVLENSATINPFAIPASVFDTSAKFVVIGGALVMAELLLLLFLF